MGLLITRKVGQSIVIDDKTTVTVSNVSQEYSGDGYVVRLDIDAPRSVPVHRKEIQDKVLAERELAKELEEENVE